MKLFYAEIVSFETILRRENINKLVFAHININSIRNMFELLVNQVKGNIDVLRISKTKIDDSFPLASFLIGGFSKPSG